MREPLPADMFDELCPSSLNPIRFGDKWAALIIRCLEHGPRRFSELRVPLSRVTPKVLTQSLRFLERGGLVKRTVYAQATPHVEYELTPLGRSMLHPMEVACAWTQKHWDELLDAWESYDQTTRLDRTGGDDHSEEVAVAGGHLRLPEGADDASPLVF
ncbi:winged helix-turn-helix transcriptional regulator [Streptomyces sp. NPDC096094]|uniref:winged helix-turn-helix transcriptional regulator n=1 Tax=Streptomyces sp. NPDC096094 TaxID=3366073 RepID=UPI003819C817